MASSAMDFIRSRLPADPLQARALQSPATALNLDCEIAGVLWLYFCGRTIAQLFPGGIHIEVHVYVETEQEPEPEPDDEHDAGLEWADDVVAALLDQRAAEDVT